MKKKLLIMISVSLIIVLALTACGGSAEVKPSVKSVTFAEKLDENY